MNDDLDKNKKSIKIPVFYHIPRCAGTYILSHLMNPWLHDFHKMKVREANQKNKPAKRSYCKLHLNPDDSLKFPGNIGIIASADENKLSLPGLVSSMSLDDFKKYLRGDLLEVRGVVINPLKGDTRKILDIVEEICQIASSEPYYFTILRKPLDWHRSIFYYLRDIGTWEPTYGRFDGMSFSDYINSKYLTDSWIIRNILGLPEDKQITDVEYNKAIRVLSRFNIGFFDEMPKFLKRLKEEFGFLVHGVDTNEDSINKNKLSSKEDVSELSEQDIKTFNERTKYDRMLYDHFKLNNHAGKKIKIYTYYDEIGKSNEKELIELWKLSWERQGFEAMVLGRKHVESHPYYHEFSDNLHQLHQQIMGKPLKPYGLSCYLRWLAYATREDDYFYVSDYDIINNSFLPKKPDSKLHLMDCACPCFASGTPKHFEKLCHAFVDVSKDRINELCGHINSPHYNDQEFFVYNFNETMNKAAPELKRLYDINMTRDRRNLLKEFDYSGNEYKKFQVVHFSNASIGKTKKCNPSLEKISRDKLRIRFIKDMLNDRSKV